MTNEESKFKEDMKALGYTVYRNGYPDFLLEKDNMLVFVEIKNNFDSIKPQQRRMFKLLQKHGIKVAICYGGDPKKVYEYEEGLPLQPFKYQFQTGINKPNRIEL